MLYAITSYFNPAGFQNHLAKYRVFRDHLSVPLITVELSFNGDFALDKTDADHLVPGSRIMVCPTSNTTG